MDKLQKTELLQATLFEVDNVVFKGYLDNIKNFEIEPLNTSLQKALENIRLNKITRIVYDKNENNLDKFNNVFSALHSSESSLIIILKGSEKYTDLYIGTNKINSSISISGSDAEKTLIAALGGNFPGIEYGEKLFVDDIKTIVNSIKTSDYLTSVAGVPSLKNDDKDNFVQGLEKIIDGMKGRKYTAVIQASPISRQELETMEAAYHNIYSTLSVFEQNQITLSENESIALGESISNGITKSISNSIGNTQTSTSGSSQTTSKTKTRSDWDIKKAFTMAAAGVGPGAMSGAVSGAFISGIATVGFGAPVGMIGGGMIGGVVGGVSGFVGGLRGGSKSVSKSKTENKSESNAESTTKSESESKSKTKTDSETTTKGSSKSIQVTEKNRRIQFLLESIDEQLKRIQECKSYGMWTWGAYFSGDESLVTKLGADIYSGILRGEATGLERNTITSWKRDDNSKKYEKIMNYVSQLRHPVFITPEYFRTTNLSATSLISTKEVTVAMSLPHKSLPGIPVFESIEFGRAVTTYNKRETKNEMPIGSIFNLGNIDKNLSVNLDINSLTAHTFITGSTGSGKSNSIYLILNYLWKEKKIPFLIVEPAKGEYKDVFGGYDKVNVFGTNHNHTALLKINPFAFPDGIHITEHIDKLIEILNAVWPMYAAMPAILKESVEKSYEKLGWDLLESTNEYNKTIFPDFQDLLDVLPDIIEKSAYSDEVKGNYTGALVTRVRSMTNGYFKTIFQKEELTTKELFDESCIIDLSRVGSSETKSMLMGMIFLKLQEYRTSQKTPANSNLKHITVLEEAHNLLRRTSASQNQEGANLQGKAVEMISNAIAEMRTFGEGFIIADQAPGLLDQSVIRNTNTKIILRLPDWEDRNLVGKAANLKDEQIEELARLRTGCAAVYQNDWQEAVLCQFDYFKDDNKKKFENKDAKTKVVDLRKNYRTELLKLLIEAKLANKEPAEMAKEKDIDLNKYQIYYPEIITKLLDNKIDVLNAISKIIALEKIIDKISKNDDIEIWTNDLFKEIKNNVEEPFYKNSYKDLLKIVLDIVILIKPTIEEVMKKEIEKITNNEGGLI